MLGKWVRIRVPLPEGMYGPPVEYDARESFSTDLFPVIEKRKERISKEEYIDSYERNRLYSIKLFEENKTKLEPQKPWNDLSKERQDCLYDICGYVTWAYSLIERRAVHYPNGYYIVTPKWVWLTTKVEAIRELSHVE